MSRDTLRTLVRGANPVPDPATQPADELDAFFSTIERRTSMVKQDERRPDVIPIGAEPPRPRRTALVAAAGFAAVIAVVGSIAVLTDGGPSDTTVPPATTEATTTTATEAPSPTTSAPPSPPTTEATTPPTTPAITDAEQQVIDGMIDAFNAEDIEGFVAYLTPDTMVEWSTFPIAESPYRLWGNDLVNELRRRAATDLRATEVECERGTSSILCDAVMVGGHWGAVTPVRATFQFGFSDDVLTRFRFLPDAGQQAVNADAFWTWLNESYPDEPNVLDEPIVTDEVAMLLEQRVGEYRDFLWRSTLEPAALDVIDGVVGAINAEDQAAFVGYLTPETLVTWETVAGFTSPYADWGIGIVNDLDFWATRDIRTDVASCEPSEFTPAVLCTTTMTGRLWGLIRPVDALWSFTVEDGTLTELGFSPNRGHWEMNEAGFISWLDANHPGEFGLVFPEVHTDDSLALFDARVTEYLATLEG